MNNIRLALRNLGRYRNYHFFSLIGLIAGLCCIIVIFAWSAQENQYDQFHKEARSIYLVTTDIKDNNDQVNRYPETPPPLAAALKEEVAGIEKSCHFVYLYGGRYLETDHFMNKEIGIAADSKLFGLLNFPIITGNPSALDEPNVIFLTERLALKIFPDDNPFGKVIRYGNNTDLIVRGIIRDIPENSSLKFDFLVPYVLESEDPDQWWQLSDATMIKTRKNADYQEVREISQRVFRDRITDEQYNLNMISLPRLRFNAEFEFFDATHGSRQKLYIFNSIAFLILLLASLNFLNLTTSNSLKRRDEVTIRKIHGAGTRDLVGYFLTETVLFSMIAWLFAVVLSRILIFLFQDMLHVDLSLRYLITGMVAGFILSVVFIGIVAGLFPAVSTGTLLSVRPGRTHTAFPVKQKRLKDAFVLSQFIISIALTIASLVILKQTKYMREFNAGFQTDDVVQIKMSGVGAEDRQYLIDEISRIPMVKGISCAGRSPVNLSPVFITEGWKWDGLDPKQHTAIYRLNTDQNYLDVFQIPLIRGRYFSSTGTDVKEVVINEKLAKLLGFEDPLGHIMHRGNDEFRIIGIVHDFYFQHLSNDLKPLLFMFRNDRGNLFVRFAPNTPQAVPAIRNLLENTLEQPVEISYVSDEYKSLYYDESRLIKAIVMFAFLSILLSLLGLIALVIFDTDRRVKEIGIRKVLGAETHEILFLLNRNIMKWWILGSLLASIISGYLLNRWLFSFSNRIEISWWIYIAPVLLVLSVALLSVSWYTWQAARRNPVTSLRYE